MNVQRIGLWMFAVLALLTSGPPPPAQAATVDQNLWQDTFDQLRPEGLALFRAAVL